MTSSSGIELDGRDTLVVGGTGNVGYYLVDGLLRAGARVLVPSRSIEKIERLKARIGTEKSDRIVAIPGNIGTPEGARDIQEKVQDVTSALTAVVAAPASWHQTASMFRAGFADFKNVMETRLYPHYLAAETLLPLLTPDGSYTTINGPAGFSAAPQPGTGAISVAAVAQNKLIQAFAAETSGTPRVNDIIMWAFISPNGTRPGSPLAGEQVGDFVAALSSSLGAGVHAQTIPLREPAQVDAALHGSFDLT